MIDTLLINPFIYLFKSYYNNYLFDVNTNTILKISDNCYDYLDKLIYNSFDVEDVEAEDNEELQKELMQLYSEGYLKDKRIKNISAPYIDSLDYMLNHRLGMLTLQVTRQCNFRCSYCHYTYGGESIHRSHSDDVMTWDTAKTAIDFYANRTRDRKSVNIGFYGGEPLLEFELIKKCIEYSKNLFRGKNLRYSITTNGALLDAEKLIYLIDNSTDIMVSLDGPKEIHDKNRKFASTGEGTFDSVYGNLMNLMENYPEYYNRLAYNSVVDTSLDCRKSQNFFNCDDYRIGIVKTSFMTPSYGNTRIYDEDFYLYNNYETFKGLLSLTGIIRYDDLTMFGRVIVQEVEKYRKNGMNALIQLPDEATHGGPCKPGITNVFINVNGDLFPCEKVSEAVKEMNIGNIFDGYDIESIHNLINIGNVTEKNCKECWCFAHCTICVDTANNGRTISQQSILSNCNNIRKSSEEMLKTIVAVNEGKEIVREGI